MSKLWRTFISGCAAMVCVWLFVFRLYGIGRKEHINNTSILNGSCTIQLVQGKSKRKHDDCPLNKEREGFAKLLAHWHTLATFYKIPYVIGCGSLLGQHRNGDMIPWDEDVDVLVDITKFKALQAFGGMRNFKQTYDDKFHFVVQNDFEQKEEDHRRRLSCSGKIVDEQIDSCSFVSPMARLILDFTHIDIFPYVISQDQQKVRDLDMNADYKLEDFFPFKECVFIETRTWCPRNIRGVLEAAYDDLEANHKCVKGSWVQKES